MKKNYSIISLRLIELKQHFIFKLLMFCALFLLVTGSLITIYILPLYCETFYSSFVFENWGVIYPDQDHQMIINILLITIDFLLCLFILFVLYFKYNKQYQKLFLEILYNELALNEFKLLRGIDLNMKLNRIISSYLPYKKSSKDLECVLKKEKQMSIYQLNLFEEKIKYAGMIILENPVFSPYFLQVNNLGKCVVEEYNGNGVFDFAYQNPKYSSIHTIYSSFGKKTSAIVDKEFLDTIDSLQRFCGSKIILTYSDNILTLVVPGWKLKLSEPLYKKSSSEIMEKKIDTIIKFYEYLDFLINKINQEGA